MIFIIAFVLALICLAIYIAGLLLKGLSEDYARLTQIIGISGMIYIIIFLMDFIILQCFEIYDWPWAHFWGFLIFIIMIILWYEVGEGGIYTIAMIVLVFGYLFMGPYSGYLKTYTGAIAEPLGLAWNAIQVTGYDLWLMVTDPQKYIEKSSQAAVRTEKATVSYPKGVEFKKITVLPDRVPSEQDFYVQVYAQNEGRVPASVMVKAICSSKLCCEAGTTTEAVIGQQELSYSSIPTAESSLCGPGAAEQIYPEPIGGTNYTITMMPREAINQRFGPFTAVATRLQDIGKKAEVNVSIYYSHSTSSRLMVNVMSKDEINRIMTDPLEGETLFRQEVSVGKNSPGMVAMTVGYQPLFSGKKQALIVSVVNKRPKGNVILKGDTEPPTQLNITLPASIGHGLSCKGGENFTCVSSADGQQASCTMDKNRFIVIDPKMLYYPVVCEFTTTENVVDSITDVITARLSGYTFQLTEKVGTQITMSYKPLASSSGTSTTTGTGTTSSPATTTIGAATSTT